MLLARTKNKYRFNMQVSARPMAESETAHTSAKRLEIELILNNQGWYTSVGSQQRVLVRHA